MCQMMGHLFPPVFDAVAFMIILKVYPLLFLMMCTPHQRFRGLMYGKLIWVVKYSNLSETFVAENKRLVGCLGHNDRDDRLVANRNSLQLEITVTLQVTNCIICFFSVFRTFVHVYLYRTVHKHQPHNCALVSTTVDISRFEFWSNSLN